MRHFSGHHRPKVAIEPIQTLFHHGLPGRYMPGIEYHMAFLCIGQAQKMEKWFLRGLYGKHEIVLTIQHQGGRFHS